MRRILVGAIAVVAMLGMLAVAAPAQAQTATTNVNINMPNLIILYYVGAVTFNVSEANLGTALGNPVEEVASASGIDTTVDAGVQGALLAAPVDALPFLITNAWAVRSIGSNNTQVAVSIPTATLNPGTGTGLITISVAETDHNGVPGTFASSVNWSPLGMGTAVTGSIRFAADLTGVTGAGSFEGGQITITASAL